MTKDEYAMTITVREEDRAILVRDIEASARLWNVLAQNGYSNKTLGDLHESMTYNEFIKRFKNAGRHTVSELFRCLTHPRLRPCGCKRSEYCSHFDARLLEEDHRQWRVGRKVPRNLYRGDEPIAMLASATLAREICDRLNHCDELEEENERLQRLVRQLG